MGKDNTILTVDIGSRSLRMAEFQIQGANILLMNFLTRKLELTGDESAADCFERNYLEMLVEGGFTAKRVRVALPSSTSFQRLSKLPPVLGNANVAKIIEFEASQAVPYAMHEIEWGYQLLHHEWDDTVEELNEDGEVEKVDVHNEEFEALFVAVKTEDVTCYTDVIERSGKKIDSVELSSINLFNAAVVAQVNEKECTMLLEIGAKGTCLMIADNRRIFMRNIPIGGDAVNAQIAREFGVSDQEAEDLKCRHGFIALGGAYEEPESKLAATISKIARNVMTRLHGEVSRSINVWRAMHNGNAPVKTLLAGGGSTMQYTVEFFNEKLRMPVEYLNAFGLININPVLDRKTLQASASMCQSMIGMALHSIGSCPVDISLIPRQIKKQYELDARKPYFYASAVALISCLLISVVGILQVKYFEDNRVQKIEADVKRAETQVNKIKGMKGELDRLSGDYEQSANFLKTRDQFGSLLRTLQNSIPNDRMWLVAFEPIIEQESETSGGSEADVKDDGKDRDPDTQITPEQFSSLREIKKLRLGGYIWRGDNLNKKEDRDVVKEFCEKLEDSGIFLSVHPDSRPEGSSNLSHFEIVLELKEVIKK